MKFSVLASFVGTAAAQSEHSAGAGPVDMELPEGMDEPAGKYAEMDEFDSSFWEDQFQQMDINSDGMLSLEEALNVASSEEEKESIQHFMESADLDEDGAVDLEEYKTFAEHHEQHSFDERLQIIEDEFLSADTNGDGFVRPEEVQDIIQDGADEEDVMSFFEMADTDGDGQLSYDEYVEYAFNNNFDEEEEGIEAFEPEPEL